MPKLYRTILQETYLIFAATLLILLSIILSFRFSLLLSNASNGDITLNAVFRLISLQSLRFLILLAPISFILAAIMTLSRMHRDLEISALLASGVGYVHQLKAIFFAALPLAICLIYLQLFYLPQIYSQQELIQKQAQQEAGVLLLTPHVFRTLPDGSTIYSEEIDGQHLRNFFLLRPEENGKSMIFANDGDIQLNQNERLFILNFGRRLSWDKHINDFAQFERAIFAIPTPEIKNSDKLRNIKTIDLNNSIAHRAEFISRINNGSALLIFVLFIPLLARSEIRGGRYQKVLPAFLLFAIYSNTLDWLIIMTKREKIHLFSIFYLHLLVLVLAVIYWQTTRKPNHV